MNGRPRVVFFGSSAFSVPSLRLIASGAEVTTVVTKPDKVKGRGLALTKNPVRVSAEALGIPVATPARIDDAFITSIRQQKPDVAVLVAYGKILPDALLKVPASGFVNVHPSLLPRHRGPSPVAGAILSGDTTTGVTIMLLDEKMDHGPILAQREVAVSPHEHRPALETRLAKAGAELLLPTLTSFLAGDVKPQPQRHELATYTKLLTRERGVIDWSRNATDIEQAVRAFDPWPGAATTWNGIKIKILDGIAGAVQGQPAGTPGTVLLNEGRVTIVCGTGTFVCASLQPENRKPMDPRAFLRGHPTFVGSVLPS